MNRTAEARKMLKWAMLTLRESPVASWLCLLEWAYLTHDRGMK